MLLADDVFDKAKTVRDQHTLDTGEFRRLKTVVSEWVDYRAVDETPTDMIVRVLESNKDFRAELARAIGWNQPEDTSMDLILLAFDAIQPKEGAKVSEEEAKVSEEEAIVSGVFTSIFGDDSKWKSFMESYNQTSFRTLLESNPHLRNKLSDSLGEYPGTRHLRKLAERVCHLLPKVVAGTEAADEQAQLEVLKRYLLNWETFAAWTPQHEPMAAASKRDAATIGVLNQDSPQDSHLKALLHKDYKFRQAVANAVGQPNSEAVELARLAVEMWRAIPASRLIGDSRTKIAKKENRTGRIPEELCEQDKKPADQNGWDDVAKRLEVTFARDPQKASALWKAMDWPYPFSLVLHEELTQIQERRNRMSPLAGSETTPEAQAVSLDIADNAAGGGNLPPGNHCNPVNRTEGPDFSDASDASDRGAQMKLFGVAFSGGGIRSATFNLGVLQQLSKFGVLSKVDYLSTVSGGGYIGSWLTGWIYKNRDPDPKQLHDGLKDLLSPEVPDPRAEAQRPVRFLREFSNYLTPKLGSFSFDTWTMAAVYSRNLFLNQATLISVLGFLLLLPRFMTFALTWQVEDRWMWILALVLVGTGVYFMTVNIRSAVNPDGKPFNRFIALLTSNKRLRWINEYSRDHVPLTVIGTFLAGMYFGSLWMWRNIGSLYSHLGSVYIGTAIVATFLSLLLSVLGGFYEEFRKRQLGDGWWFPVLAMITVLSAGATTGLVRADLAAMNALKNLGCSGIWHGAIWSPIMLLAAMVIPGTLQVGLMGVDFPDAGREWLSRFRAVCTVYSVWWVAFLGAAIYGPWLVWKVAGGVHHWAAGITAGWIVTTIGGILAGKSDKTGADKEGTPKFSWLQVLARVAPPLFAAGIVLLIATGELVLLAHGAAPRMKVPSGSFPGWTLFDRHHVFDLSGWFVDQPGWLLLVLAAAGVILAWRVDINEFSMHHFYKNRLVRCYLGASNMDRRPDGFTGFDARDDVRLALLKAVAPKDAGGKPPDAPYLGPYPIINATLNLSAGKQLAWQERKGASFIFSPCFCGFDVQGWASSTADEKKNSRVTCLSQDLSPAGYRKTSSYTHKDGPFLGTSFSISGAAANPNQGYNTSPAVAFLMTIFDVRLGWWVGNPRRGTEWKQSSPTFGLAALLSELVGSTDDTSRFVNLSDGGHFDNMGLYELVRRRCSLILLCDAEQDRDFKFEGLGSAIRKCRIDFGACIEIDTSLIRPEKQDALSRSHCAVGKIVYLDGSEGTLVYIKPSLTGDEPEDVTQYHCAHADFPHESTADQWFAESQFESYRALGFHVAEESLTPASRWVQWKPTQPDIPSLVRALRDYWYPENPNLKDNASRNTATLIKMLDTIRETKDLYELGRRLFPGITVPQPSEEVDTKKFYFGLALLQLVEDIYFDFKLDRQVWAKDPRIGGWNYLFRTWKRVPEVAAAWNSARNTFRKDFQVFWDGL